MKLTVNETVVVQTRGRLNDGSEGKLFTTQPKGNVIVYANDLDLMKDCVEKIKEQGKGRSTPAVTPVFVRYLDGGETFTAIRESGRGDDRQLQFVLNWRNKRSAIVDVAWLMEDENHGVGGYSAEEIRTFWKLPDPVALLPTVTKADRDALWLRLELKNKEAAEAALFIIRAHLGFVAIP